MLRPALCLAFVSSIVACASNPSEHADSAQGAASTGLGMGEYIRKYDPQDPYMVFARLTITAASPTSIGYDLGVIRDPGDDDGAHDDGANRPAGGLDGATAAFDAASGTFIDREGPNCTLGFKPAGTGLTVTQRGTDCAHVTHGGFPQPLFTNGSFDRDTETTPNAAWMTPFDSVETLDQGELDTKIIVTSTAPFTFNFFVDANYAMGDPDRTIDKQNLTATVRGRHAVFNGGADCKLSFELVPPPVEGIIAKLEIRKVGDCTQTLGKGLDDLPLAIPNEMGEYTLYDQAGHPVPIGSDGHPR